MIHNKKKPSQCPNFISTTILFTAVFIQLMIRRQMSDSFKVQCVTRIKVETSKKKSCKLVGKPIWPVQRSSSDR